MPAKRSSASLTGGTGDVNPQTYILQSEAITITGPVTAPVTSVRTFPLPVPRYPAGNGRSIVFEILEVEWFCPNMTPPATSTMVKSLYAAITTDPIAPIATNLTDPLYSEFFANPRHISIFGSEKTILVNTDGAAIDNEVFVRYVDNLTDQAGHGILVATDSISLHTYAAVIGAGSDELRSQVTARIAYRLKEVSLTEYIGIVQSQQ